MLGMLFSYRPFIGRTPANYLGESLAARVPTGLTAWKHTFYGQNAQSVRGFVQPLDRDLSDWRLKAAWWNLEMGQDREQVLDKTSARTQR
jgi:hypothetical protein